MEYAKSIALKLWNTAPNLLAEIVSRSSGKKFTVPEVVAKPPLSTTILRSANYVYLALGIVRFLPAGIFMAPQFETLLHSYLKFDPLMYVGIKSGQMNQLTALCASPLTICVLYCDIVAHMKRFNYIWRVPHDLVVTNQLHFFALNPQYRFQLDLSHPIRTLRRNAKILYHFWYPDEWQHERPIRFEIEHMRYAPPLSRQTRVRALAITWFAQLFITILLFVTVLLLSFGAIFYNSYLIAPRVDNTWQHVVAFIDVLIICVNAYRIISQVLCFAFYINLVAFTLVSHYTEMFDRFETVMADYCTEKINVYRLFRETYVMYEQYQRGAMEAKFADKFISSDLVLYGGISHFTFNVYLIAAVYFVRNMSIVDYMVAYTMMVLQVVSTYAGIMPILYMTAVLHRPGKLLLKLMFHFNGTRFGRFKLALLILIEQTVGQKNLWYFRCGFFGHISPRSICEFIFFYSGKFLLCFYILYV